MKGDYQSKLTLMSESLRNSGRIWVPKSRETAEKIRKKEIKPSDVPEEERDYYLERKYPSFGNLAPARHFLPRRQGGLRRRPRRGHHRQGRIPGLC